MPEFQIAIVGGGGVSRAHIEAAKQTGGRVVVAAVVDPNESALRAASDAAAARPFASFDQFLADPIAKTTRGVIVCTPPSIRIDLVAAALRNGMSVLVEKPLAHTLDDAKELLEISRQYPNLMSAVGYCHRFTPAVIEMNRRVRAGEIGNPSRFENTFAAPLMRLREKWMSDPVISGGGAFMDMGCHSADLFLHLMGACRLESAVFHHAWKGRAESAATVLLRSNAGVAGVIQSGWCEPARFQLALVGDAGSFSYDYDRPAELRFRPNDGPEQNIVVETHEVRFRRQLEAFAELSVGGNPIVRPASFDNGATVAWIVNETQSLAR